MFTFEEKKNEIRELADEIFQGSCDPRDHNRLSELQELLQQTDGVVGLCVWTDKHTVHFYEVARGKKGQEIKPNPELAELPDFEVWYVGKFPITTQEDPMVKEVA